MLEFQLRDGSWGTVCASFDIFAAEVACEQLGYKYELSSYETVR